MQPTMVILVLVTPYLICCTTSAPTPEIDNSIAQNYPMGNSELNQRQFGLAAAVNVPGVNLALALDTDVRPTSPGTYSSYPYRYGGSRYRYGHYMSQTSADSSSSAVGYGYNNAESGKTSYSQSQASKGGNYPQWSAVAYGR